MKQGYLSAATLQESLKGGAAGVKQILPALPTKWIYACGALGLSGLIWSLPPAGPLEANGIHFLATLAGAVVLWMFEVLDEYVVALLLLLSWIVFAIVPAEIALSGFSKPSWLFVLSALGIAAALAKTGLLRRASFCLFRSVRPTYRNVESLIAGLGLASTAVVPRGMARVAIVAPIAQAAIETLGAKTTPGGPRRLALATFVGCSVPTFMFLTGGTYCLVGWGLIADDARLSFGWLTWLVAAFPAGLFCFLFVLAAAKFLFPLGGEDGQEEIPTANFAKQLADLGPFGREEWIALILLGATLLAWITKPFHGITEPTVAFAAFVAFLVSGVIDKKTFKTQIEWGFLLFFGVAYSLGFISSHLNIDRWLISILEPYIRWFAIDQLTVSLVYALFGLPRSTVSSRDPHGRSFDADPFVMVPGAWHSPGHPVDHDPHGRRDVVFSVSAVFVHACTRYDGQSLFTLAGAQALDCQSSCFVCRIGTQCSVLEGIRTDAIG